MDDGVGNSLLVTNILGSGQLVFSGSVGAFNVSGTAQSKPLLGGPSVGLLKFVNLRVATTGAVATPLTIKLSDTDFPARSAFRDRTILRRGLLSNGDFTGNAYFDPANVDFAEGGLNIPMGTYTAGATPLELDFDSGWVPFNFGEVPYSIVLKLEVTATGALDLNFTQGEIVAVQAPEPSAVFLASIGGLFLVARQIRRSRRSSPME